MKNYIIIFTVFLFPFFGNAQDTAITYTQVVEIPTKNKFEIYDKAVLWCAEAFNSAKAAVQYTNRDAGILTINSNADVIIKGKNNDYTRNVTFKIKFESKDKKYKVTVYDMNWSIRHSFEELASEHPLTSSTTSPYRDGFENIKKSNEKWALLKQAVDRDFKLLLSNMMNSITKDENW